MDRKTLDDILRNLDRAEACIRYGLTEDALEDVRAARRKLEAFEIEGSR